VTGVTHGQPLYERGVADKGWLRRRVPWGGLHASEGWRLKAGVPGCGASFFQGSAYIADYKIAKCGNPHG
jgi:hypothetical protein